MIKTLAINETQELTLSNNISWAMIYKSQFGHDIVPDIMPIMSAVFKLIGELADQQGKTTAEILKTIDGDAVEDALIELCALQFTDLINLTWAMAKAADKGIPAPEKWAAELEEFPLDIIVPGMLELLAKGLVSSKNLTSLQKSLNLKAN